MSLIGTFETCRPALKMSVHRGRSEVTGGRSERRDWYFSDLVVWANDRFAPKVVIPRSRFLTHLQSRAVLKKSNCAAWDSHAIARHRSGLAPILSTAGPSLRPHGRASAPGGRMRSSRRRARCGSDYLPNHQVPSCGCSTSIEPGRCTTATVLCRWQLLAARF